jgi:hypothetical protein
MESKKKAVAAAVAVIDYIRAEEAAKGTGSMGARAAMPAPGSGPVRLWGVSGRQYQMQMRSMMQMRTFK